MIIHKHSRPIGEYGHVSPLMVRHAQQGRSFQCASWYGVNTGFVLCHKLDDAHVGGCVFLE